MKIRSIEAREILDSRGQPTVSATVSLADGTSGTAAVPAGASTGSHEARELRDNDDKRFGGRGVLQAVANVEKISQRLVGMDAAEQAVLDRAMIDLDGTPDKKKLGANAILAVSLAAACAEAKAEKKPLYAYLAKFNLERQERFTLPIPLLNVINGGRHANWSTDFQEYLILPIGAASFSQALRMGAEVYTQLRQILKQRGQPLTVGDEGGFAPAVETNEEPLELLVQAISKAGYQPGKDIALGLDVAASEFFQDKVYELKKEKEKFSAEELAAYYQKLAGDYPLVSLEDPFAEDDWQAFSRFSAANNLQVVGDDLYATNLERLRRGLEEKSSNAILIKPNQIGTLTETMAVINEAKQHGWATIISHRSGETEDSFIADLAVAAGAGQIKAGAPARGERLAKYNRLLKIEEQLAESGHYARWPW